MAQVDLKRRHHRNQNLEALGKMAYGIERVVIEKAGEFGLLDDTMGLNGFTRPVNNLGLHQLDTKQIQDIKRKPMSTLPEYQEKFNK